MANGRTTLDELSYLIGQLRHERDKIQKQLADVEEELRAVEITMNLYRRAGVSYEPEAYKSIVPELQGKTLVGALTHIASKSGGILKVVDAKRLLSEAGMIRNPKNALSMLYTMMSRSGKFEKVDRGEYRLLDAQRVDTQQASLTLQE